MQAPRAAVEPGEPGQLAEAETGCKHALAQEHPPHFVAHFRIYFVTTKFVTRLVGGEFVQLDCPLSLGERGPLRAAWQGSIEAFSRAARWGHNIHAPFPLVYVVLPLAHSQAHPSQRLFI